MGSSDIRAQFISDEVAADADFIVPVLGYYRLAGRLSAATNSEQSMRNFSFSRYS